jgi:hypothetical protein
MQTTSLLKKGWAVGIFLLFIAIVVTPIYAAPACAPQLYKKGTPQETTTSQGAALLGAQGFDMVFIWGTFEEKVRKFPLLSLEVRNRDPWDNRTITVFGLFLEGTSFHVYLIKAYWVTCLPLRSLHLGIVGNNSLFVVASGRIIVYQ